MKKFPVFFLLMSFWVFTGFFSENGPNTVSTERFKAKFNMKNGMLDGVYVSFYANGIKKAEGHFNCNMRQGRWTVWDSTGKIVAKRDYKNSFEFKQVFPESDSKAIAPPVYSLVRNDAGLNSYFDFKQSDVVISKRIWRELGTDEENSFFGNDDFYHALIDSVAEGKIRIYDSSSDDLQKKMTDDGIKKLIDTTGKEIIGFKIKEDWFFDSKRKNAEKRIVAICPVVCKKDTSRVNDDDYSFDMGWLHFPDIRNTLGAISIQNPNPAVDIKNLDDLFFFRYFTGMIYKEANVRNLELKDYCKPGSIADEQLRIEIQMIETEHDLWMKYSQ